LNSLLQLLTQYGNILQTRMFLSWRKESGNWMGGTDSSLASLAFFRWIDLSDGSAGLGGRRQAVRTWRVFSWRKRHSLYGGWALFQAGSSPAAGEAYPTGRHEP
jgi:hypothetical protein